MLCMQLFGQRDMNRKQGFHFLWCSATAMLDPQLSWGDLDRLRESNQHPREAYESWREKANQYIHVITCYNLLELPTVLAQSCIAQTMRPKCSSLKAWSDSCSWRRFGVALRNNSLLNGCQGHPSQVNLSNTNMSCAKCLKTCFHNLMIDKPECISAHLQSLAITCSHLQPLAIACTPINPHEARNNAISEAVEAWLQA